MNKEVRNWLLVGISENWETALSQPVPIWGLKLRYQEQFQALSIGDIVWFYATSPISGVIGLGTIKDKYVDNINLVWDKEQEEKEVIWPLRFRIHVLKVIGRKRWKKDNVKISDFHLNWQIGFQLLQSIHVKELITRSEQLFGGVSQGDFFRGATISEPLVAEPTTQKYVALVQKERQFATHRDLQQKIAEIGKLQFYHTQLEYPVELPNEDKNLDVVWKREIAGVPTFAFEVELSGVIEKAIARLKFAYVRWNSRPRIVVPQKYVKKVNNIVATEDRDFCNQFKMYEPIQLLELLNKKRELKNLEQNLEVY